MKNQKGLTLVELLVVIAIIAVLCAFAFVSLSNIREKGRDAKRISDMDALKTAIELVNSETGTYDQEIGCQAGDKVSYCVNGKLISYLPTVKVMNDPTGTVSCAENCTEPCDYAFSNIIEDDYSVLFYLETGAGAMKEAGCYFMDVHGVDKYVKNNKED